MIETQYQTPVRVGLLPRARFCQRLAQPNLYKTVIFDQNYHAIQALLDLWISFSLPN
jgi:hypothetical protein